MSCNLRCSYCCTQNFTDPYGELKSYDVLESGIAPEFPLPILEELSELYEPEVISICGYGETMLCANIKEVINYAFEKFYGYKWVDIFTNGLAKPFEWYKELIDENEHRGAQFALAMSVHLESNNFEAIKKIADYIDSLSSKSNYIGKVRYFLHYVVTKKNIQDVIDHCRKNTALALKGVFIGSHFEKDIEDEIGKQLLSGTGLPLDWRKYGVSKDGTGRAECYLDSVNITVRKDFISVFENDSNYNTEPIGSYKIGSSPIKLR